PYESFDASVERFIREGTADPSTLGVKMTVYRVGDDTPFVRWLIMAAESGKQVACVIELKARFDENRNLHCADALLKVGVHVSLGLLELSRKHGADDFFVEILDGLNLLLNIAHVAGFVNGFDVNEDKIILLQGLYSVLTLAFIVGVQK